MSRLGKRSCAPASGSARLRAFAHAIAAALLILPVGIDHAWSKPRPQAAGMSQDEIEAHMAIALMRSQPVGLQLYGDALGWVKRCGGEPSVCTVSRGFSLDPTIVPTMKTTITTTSAGGTHPVFVAVPLDQDLRAGFALRADESDAALGTYRRCSPLGCAGEVVLADGFYDALAAARTMDVIIKDINGRTVMYQAPLDGLQDAIRGPALSDEEFNKAMQAAGERLVAAAQARESAALAAAGGGTPAVPATPDATAPTAGGDVPPATPAPPGSVTPPEQPKP